MAGRRLTDVDAFDGLGLGEELVEALALEGVEQPTSLQVNAIPLVGRGHSALLAAGPGSGVTWAWAAGLLGRLDQGAVGTRAIVLAPTCERASYLAESMARVADALGQSVAAMSGTWFGPEEATLVFGTPTEFSEAVSGDRTRLGQIDAIVVDQLSRMEATGDLMFVERVLSAVPDGAQRILSALPVSGVVSELVRRHLRRAPKLGMWDPAEKTMPKRGIVRFRIANADRETVALDLVRELLGGGADHVAVFRRGDDQLADFGDRISLRGCRAGAPGDDLAPVWLTRDPLAVQRVSGGRGTIAVLSCDAPTDPDVLDQRHSLSPKGAVLVLPREVPHLRAIARAAAYKLEAWPPPPRPSPAVNKLFGDLSGAMDDDATTAYIAALEPLLRERDPAEVAAAAVALWRAEAGSAATHGYAETTAREVQPAWSKLFLGCGKRDGIGPGDVLGAILGEAKIKADAVGRISIQESHTLVDVRNDVAHTVIKAINGTTLRGRAVRADFDRPKKGGGPGRTGGRSNRGGPVRSGTTSQASSQARPRQKS